MAWKRTVSGGTIKWELLSTEDSQHLPSEQTRISLTCYGEVSHPELFPFNYLISIDASSEKVIAAISNEMTSAFSKEELDTYSFSLVRYSTDSHFSTCLGFNIDDEGQLDKQKQFAKFCELIKTHLYLDIETYEDISKDIQLRKIDSYYTLFSIAQESNKQDLLDMLFYRACGGTGSQPDIENVKGDPQFLVAVAIKCRRFMAAPKELKEWIAFYKTSIKAKLFQELFRKQQSNASQAEQDGFFYVLSDGTGSEPDIKNVKGDPDFLVDVAMKFHFLTTIERGLEQEKLKDSMTFLENNLAAVFLTKNNMLSGSETPNAESDELEHEKSKDSMTCSGDKFAAILLAENNMFSGSETPNAESDEKVSAINYSS